MDLSKLSPAPWEEKPGTFDVKEAAEDGCTVAKCWSSTFAPTREIARVNRKFIALARNDLDVKLRRGWHTEKCAEGDQWYVPHLVERLLGKIKEEGDPVWAAMYQDGHDVGLLTKADRWMKENIESKP